MHKILLGSAALMLATASQSATTVLNFAPATSGNLGVSSKTYTSGPYSVVANGYSSFNFGTNSGTADNLYGKADGGDENGIGLAGDPHGQHEIWYTGTGSHSAIVLNFTASDLSLASAAQFEMGSTTSGESWGVYGFNSTTSLWSLLIPSGTADGTTSTPTFTNLPGWGTYSRYGFISNGTNCPGANCSFGNVLLEQLRFTNAVPEPATWTMMLIGFGAIGFAMRRRKTQENWRARQDSNLRPQA